MSPRTRIHYTALAQTFDARMKCMTTSFHVQSNISNAVNVCSYKHVLCKVIKNSKSNHINNNGRVSVRHCELISFHTDSSVSDQIQFYVNVIHRYYPIQIVWSVSTAKFKFLNDNFVNRRMTPRIKMELSFNLLMVNEAQALCHDWLKSKKRAKKSTNSIQMEMWRGMTAEAASTIAPHAEKTVCWKLSHVTADTHSLRLWFCFRWLLRLQSIFRHVLC